MFYYVLEFLMKACLVGVLVAGILAVALLAFGPFS